MNGTTGYETDASPILTTTRLTLRPFVAQDAARLAELGGSRWIADTMISVPHPYTREQAAANIAAFTQEARADRGMHFAITATVAPTEFVGYIALKYIDRDHDEAELSFWVGESFAGRGYMTEAGERIMRFAFGECGLNRVCAYHMRRNGASEKLLEKLQFKREGHLRERVRKWGRYEDVYLWARLRRDVI